MTIMNTTRTLPRTIIATLAAIGLVTVSACATEEDTQSSGDTSPTNQTTQPADTTAAGDDSGLTATVTTTDGTELGTVEFEEGDAAVRVAVEFSGLEPGFYGIHVHQVGLCETDSAAPNDPANVGDFLSAGSHLGAGDTSHPDHPGDLPQLLVKDSGDAVLTFETDRFTVADLEDEDGSALMIHSNPDNYANIPGRYSPDGADEETLGAGDAGSRLACGVIAS